MKSKLLSLGALVVFTVMACLPSTALAQTYDPTEIKTITTLASQTLVASGTLTGVSTLNVPNKVLTFNSDGTADQLVVTASQVIKVEFNDNTDGYQAIIVSTNNKNTGLYTNTDPLMYGAGLVGETDSTVSAPLHWVVFPTEALATPYAFTKFTAADQASNSNYKEGYVDNRIQPYVVDQSQPDFNQNGVIGYTSVIYDINLTTAKLADRPVDDGAGDPRQVTNGEAYMKFAVDYHTVKPQAYSTDTLTLDLVTVS